MSATIFVQQGWCLQIPDKDDVCNLLPFRQNPINAIHVAMLYKAFCCCIVYAIMSTLAMSALAVPSSLAWPS
jgi:hypothetical protein